MAKTRKKLTRKELLKKDDAFLSAASQGARWAIENRTQMIIGGVLTVAIILGTWGVVEHTRSRDQQASLLLKRGLDLLDGTVLPEGSEEEPNPDGSEPTFASEQDKWKAAREQFLKVTRETGGSGVADLAEFVAADLAQKLGDAEAAEKEFSALADELSPDDSLYFEAVERAAYLQEARGDLDGALRTLGNLANRQSGFYTDVASYHQARLYIAEGKNDRARNILERIQDDFPSSMVLEEVRDRLAEIGPAEAASEESDEGTPDNQEAGSDAAPADGTEEPAANAAEADGTEEPAANAAGTGASADASDTTP